MLQSFARITQPFCVVKNIFLQLLQIPDSQLFAIKNIFQKTINSK
jgi:hypothetical protein